MTTDGVYELNDEHVAEGISHLIQFFRDGPRNQSVLTATLGQAQEVEDALWDLPAAFDLNSATGAALDVLGSVLGEPRGDFGDHEYRGALRTRILINNSGGRLEDLIKIGVRLLPSTDPPVLLVRELYPASISMFFDSLGDVSLATAYRLLKSAKTAGVRLMVSYGDEVIGAADGSPAGGVIGSSDGSPAGFAIGSGT